MKDKKVYIIILIATIISITSSYVLAATLVNSKDVYYEDNSGLAVNNVQAAIDGTCTKFSDQLITLQTTIINKIYPVGSIYISYNSTNPSSLFGGTWENYGSGRVLKGINSGTAGTTGGSDTVTLKEANLPAHTHDISHTHTTKSGSIENGIATNTTSSWTVSAPSVKSFGEAGTNTSVTYKDFTAQIGGTGSKLYGVIYSNTHSHTVTGTIPSLSTDSISTTTSGSTGSGSSFSVQNAYITVYMWRRIK